MGKPSTCSDVFSAGLVLYRMFSGQLPEWPYQWPLPGLERARRRLRPEFIQMIRKSLEIDPRRRQQDAEQMLAQFRRLRPTALRPVPGQTPPRSRKTPRRGLTGPHWRAIRQQQFMKTFGKLLDARHECRHCAGPVAESMAFCPWCGRQRKVHRDETRFPIHCPRCRRGMKLDWRYCPWCYGAGFEPDSARRYTDRRYEGRCTNARCDRKLLMPFMRYCPWCRRKVKRKWKIPNSSDTCAACGWGVVGQFWDYCPWCGKPALTG
jgi:hypothetical protein